MTTLFSKHNQPENRFSQLSPERTITRLLHFPLARVLVFALFLAPLILINTLVVFQLIEQVEEPLATNIDLLRMLITIPFALFSLTTSVTTVIIPIYANPCLML